MGQQSLDAGRLLSNELLGGLLPERLQEDAARSSVASSELVGVILAQAADDGERGQLWLCGKPGFDRGNVRVELGWHTNPCLIRPFGSPVCGTRIAGLHHHAERLCKSDCVGLMIVPAGARCSLPARCWPRASPARRSNAIGRVPPGPRGSRPTVRPIERAILLAQPPLHRRGGLRMRQRPLTGRRRRIIALDHFRSLAALLLQLE